MNEKEINTAIVSSCVVIFAFFLGITIVYYSITLSKELECQPVVQTDTIVETVIDTTNYFDLAIDHLKESEGLRLIAYKCPAGYKTIGYGHRVYESDAFITSDTISLETAEWVLREDLSFFYRRVNDILIDYPKNKRVALSLFAFNFGYKGLLDSKLTELCIKKKPIGHIIMKYVHYKSNNKYIHSERLYKNRLFELDMYNIN